MDRKINRFSSNRHIFASLPLRLFGHFVRVAGGGDLEVEDLKRRDKFENLRRETTLTTDKLSLSLSLSLSRVYSRLWSRSLSKLTHVRRVRIGEIKGGRRK